MDARRTPRRVLWPLLSVPVILLLLLAACSASATQAPHGGTDYEAAPAVPAPGQGGTGSDAGAPTAAPAPGANQDVGPQGPMIVRTGSLELETASVDSAVTKARDLIVGMGGYVAGSDESTSGDRHVATITYRIPVEHWQDAVTGLRGLADRVVSEKTQADEVTSQVVDLNARLDNLRSSEASLRDIMARAGTITDVLSVQTQLSGVEQEIEQLTAQQQDLTNRSALGTLASTWETPVAAVVEVQSGWSLGAEIDHAAAQTIAFGQTMASALVWLVVVGVPVFGPVIVLLLVVAWFARRYRQKHPAGPRQPGWSPLPPGPAPQGPAPQGPVDA